MDTLLTMCFPHWVDYNLFNFPSLQVLELHKKYIPLGSGCLKMFQNKLIGSFEAVFPEQALLKDYKQPPDKHVLKSPEKCLNWGYNYTRMWVMVLKEMLTDVGFFVDYGL